MCRFNSRRSVPPGRIGVSPAPPDPGRAYRSRDDHRRDDPSRDRQGATRRPCRPLAVLALALLASTGCGDREPKFEPLSEAPYTRAAWSYGRSKGHKLITDHYVIYTTLADEALLGATPQAIETAYAFYRRLVPTARPLEERMRVYVFAQRGEWADFTRRYAGERASKLLQVRNGGYMERGVTAIEYVATQTTFPILTHEGFHQFLFHCAFPNVPAWLNEGLSVLCEGQRWGAVGLKEFDPWYNPIRRNAVIEARARGQLIPLRRLVRMNAGHVVGGQPREINTYYGQLWALMLFLQEAEQAKYAESFRRLLGVLADENVNAYAEAGMLGSDARGFNAGEGLFRNFISDDFERLEQEFESFLNDRIAR